MAISERVVGAYDRMFARHPGAGRLMIFGRPKLMWNDAPTPEDFFKGYGFTEVHTLDISAADGASHMHDLNRPLPTDLVGQYDVVMTAGTLEHIFNVTTALRNAASLLKEGGLLYCGAPANNWVDHGFWQISPTLKFDYFAANGFEFEESMAIFTDKDQQVRLSYPLYPGEGHLLNRSRSRVSHSIIVRRVKGATVDRTPLQALYANKLNAQPTNFRFRAREPLELRGDCYSTPSMTRFALSSVRALDGRFAAPFSDKAHPASLQGRPFRSSALVYEDKILLPWVVSDPSLVKDRLGSFHHGPGFVHFSTIDGSDPRQNGRIYELAFPVSLASALGSPSVAAPVQPSGRTAGTARFAP